MIKPLILTFSILTPRSDCDSNRTSTEQTTVVTAEAEMKDPIANDDPVRKLEEKECLRKGGRFVEIIYIEKTPSDNKNKGTRKCEF